jgi:predicted SprT family Zn-dependent metalloprotease
MDTGRGMTLAHELLTLHGLSHLQLDWHRSNKSVGICHFSRLPADCEWHAVKITLSRGLVGCNEESVIRNTILHEIAHAKAGHLAKHGPLWKLAAISVGAKPEAKCGLGVNLVPTKIKAVCPLCSQLHYFTRMPIRTKYCLCQRARLRNEWVGLSPERIGQ